MPIARNGPVQIYYEQRTPEAGADTSRRTAHVLMIMGLGAQLTQWPDRLVSRLVSQGYAVVLLDNRDVGLSSKCAPARDASAQQGPAYGLDDMADDCICVLDALGLRDVHVIGASLGGMIGQVLAIRYPDRVRSLVSLMSTTGSSAVPGPTPEVTAKLMRRTRPPSRSPEDRRRTAIEYMIDMHRTLAITPEARDLARIQQIVELAYQRDSDPRGTTRQLAAVLVAKDREPALRTLRLPALVIHGEEDPLIRIQGGERTHACIQGSRFVRIPGMGHYMLERALPQIEAEVLDLLEAAESPPS